MRPATTSSHSFANAGKLALAVGLLGALLAAPQAHAQQGDAARTVAAESAGVVADKSNVSLEGQHHYMSPAERANDALLITEVKSALADDGVANDSPIVVDCDHGKVVLGGVMKSEADAKHAGEVAASAQGVVAVNNQLTWR